MFRLIKPPPSPVLERQPIFACRKEKLSITPSPVLGSRSRISFPSRQISIKTTYRDVKVGVCMMPMLPPPPPSDLLKIIMAMVNIIKKIKWLEIYEKVKGAVEFLELLQKLIKIWKYKPKLATMIRKKEYKEFCKFVTQKMKLEVENDGQNDGQKVDLEESIDNEEDGSKDGIAKPHSDASDKDDSKKHLPLNVTASEEHI